MSPGRLGSEAVSFHSCIDPSQQLHRTVTIHVVRRRDRPRRNPARRMSARRAAISSFSFNRDHDAYFRAIGDGAKEKTR
jgi:hypothetical protein